MAVCKRGGASTVGGQFCRYQDGASELIAMRRRLPRNTPSNTPGGDSSGFATLPRPAFFLLSVSQWALGGTAAAPECEASHSTLVGRRDTGGELWRYREGGALSPQPSALSPQPSALSPQPSALSSQPSALSPRRHPHRHPHYHPHCHAHRHPHHHLHPLLHPHSFRHPHRQAAINAAAQRSDEQLAQLSSATKGLAAAGRGEAEARAKLAELCEAGDAVQEAAANSSTRRHELEVELDEARGGLQPHASKLQPHPGCNPMHPGCNPMHLGCNATHSGSQPCAPR